MHVPCEAEESAEASSPSFVTSTVFLQLESLQTAPSQRGSRGAPAQMPATSWRSGQPPGTGAVESSPPQPRAADATAIPMTIGFRLIRPQSRNASAKHKTFPADLTFLRGPPPRAALRWAPAGLGIRVP